MRRRMWRASRKIFPGWREKLGVPQSARDVFVLLAQGGWINVELADKLKRIWWVFATLPCMIIRRCNYRS